MAREIERSDRGLLEVLRKRRGMTVEQLGEALGVTATAVRLRLERLAAAGAVSREEIRHGRGRPSFQYSLTEHGEESLGHNMADLARVMWSEIRQIEDDSVRNKLLERIGKRMSEMYEGEIAGATARERLESLASILRSRQVTAEVARSTENALPVLKITGCPYPGISSADHHDICEVEEAMFGDLLGLPIRLTECRCHSTNGACTFVVDEAPATTIQARSASK